MFIQEFIVLSEAEKLEASSYDNENVALGPRRIDSATPGIAANFNPSATSFGDGDPVPLDGKYVASKAIVDDPEYATYAPEMVTFLSAMPWCTLDSEVIFKPDEV